MSEELYSQIYRWPAQSSEPFVRERLTPKDDGLPAHVMDSVGNILRAVQQDGDAALVRFSKQFDEYALDANELRVSDSTIAESAAKAPASLKNAIRRAISNVRRFHEPQKPSGYTIEGIAGGKLRYLWRAVASAALYVPGGRAAYPSTVIMNAVPAQVAGVERIAVLTVPGMVESNPAVAFAIQELGLTEVYRVGGAHSIAAAAYGTTSIAPVDVIVGPGNAYVAGAKRMVYGRVGIDSVAGPSEVLILADDSANPAWVAQDLIAQAEHDPMARCVLASTSESLLTKVVEVLNERVGEEPRADIVRSAWNDHGLLLLADSVDDLVALTNQMAPEHLQVILEDAPPAESLVAGAIFVGNYSPTALGDYIAGPNHVLPTGTTARFSGPLGVHTFMRPTSVIESNAEMSAELVGPGAEIADYEQLAGHARALRLRTEKA